MASFKIRTESVCECKGDVIHIYECKCDDYWGYCKNKSCSWYECNGCGKLCGPPKRVDTRQVRTDKGTEKELNALRRLLSPLTHSSSIP